MDKKQAIRRWFFWWTIWAAGCLITWLFTKWALRQPEPERVYLIIADLIAIVVLCVSVFFGWKRVRDNAPRS